ncbi:MAG: hypothetical protein FJ082_02420 [Cyanobacteria bacterium K_Offshore_surface_m2_011]|nr:hypothetical protein [Cyanobacteria bacterium K_Offshore_surface_m2_011]
MNADTGPTPPWGAALDAAALGAVATALAILSVALVLIPQRLAQRPASQGIVSLHLGADGRLRLWNQPIPSAQLAAVLKGLQDSPGQPTLRLIPDPDVPWGSVQQLMERLGRTDLPLELQLP